MAILMKTDGSVDESFTLNGFKHAQNTVGGLVEVVYLGDKYVLLVHEEAILNDEPLNTTATVLASMHNFSDPLYGTVIVLKPEEAKKVLK